MKRKRTKKSAVKFNGTYYLLVEISDPELGRYARRDIWLLDYDRVSKAPDGRIQGSCKQVYSNECGPMHRWSYIAISGFLGQGNKNVKYTILTPEEYVLEMI